MPILDAGDDLQQQITATGAYKYSAVRMDDLGATEYTLVGIAVDTSSSVAGFAIELEKMLHASVESCQRSPRADNLMLRITEFNSCITELLGWRLLGNLNRSDFVNRLQVGGSTSLHDAINEQVEVLLHQAAQMSAQDYEQNGILFVITDGEDIGSTLTPLHVANTIRRARSNEALQGLQLILIGVLDDDPQDSYKHDRFLQVSNYLSQLKTDLGFDQYIEMQDVNEKSLAKLAAFISKSISSQSQSLQGGAFQPQSLTI